MAIIPTSLSELAAFNGSSNNAQTVNKIALDGDVNRVLIGITSINELLYAYQHNQCAGQINNNIQLGN